MATKDEILRIRLQVDESGNVSTTILNTTKSADALAQSMNRASSSTASGFSRAQASVVSFAAAFSIVERLGSVAASGAERFIGLADTANLLSARIKLATGSGQDFAAVEDRIFAIAQDTRSSFEDSVTLYTRLARSTQELKLNQDDLATVTKTVNEAIITSGASATEAQNGIIQFSQALALGRFQGQDLKAVLEDIPGIGRLIADGLGVPLGSLRELGSTGELTSDKVVKALIKMSSTADREFAQIPTTVGQAFQKIENEALRAVEKIDRATGASNALAQAISSIADEAERRLPSVVDWFGRVQKAASDNRGALSGVAVGLGGVAAAAGGISLAGRLIGLLASPLGVVTTAAVGLSVAYGAVADKQREVDRLAADDQAIKNLAKATDFAAEMGQKLTIAQTAAILQGRNWNEVLLDQSLKVEKVATSTTAAIPPVQRLTEAEISHQKAIATLGVAMAEIDSKASLLGSSFDATAARISVLQGALDGLYKESKGQVTPEIAALTAQLKGLQEQAATNSKLEGIFKPFADGADDASKKTAALKAVLGETSDTALPTAKAKTNELADALGEGLSKAAGIGADGVEGSAGRMIRALEATAEQAQLAGQAIAQGLAAGTPGAREAAAKLAAKSGISSAGVEAIKSGAATPVFGSGGDIVDVRPGGNAGELERRLQQSIDAAHAAAEASGPADNQGYFSGTGGALPSTGLGGVGFTPPSGIAAPGSGSSNAQSYLDAGYDIGQHMLDGINGALQAPLEPPHLEIPVNASGSPSLPFSDYFTKYAPGVLNTFAGSVPGLTLPSSILDSIRKTAGFGADFSGIAATLGGNSSIEQLTQALMGVRETSKQYGEAAYKSRFDSGLYATQAGAGFRTFGFSAALSEYLERSIEMQIAKLRTAANNPQFAPAGSVGDGPAAGGARATIAVKDPETKASLDRSATATERSATAAERTAAGVERLVSGGFMTAPNLAQQVEAAQRAATGNRGGYLLSSGR